MGTYQQECAPPLLPPLKSTNTDMKTKYQYKIQVQMQIRTAC